MRDEFESHCYVDYPGMALAGGSAHTRKKTLSIILLLLMCLGLDISWMKAQRGQTIEWFGVIVELVTHNGRPAVKISIPASKLCDIIA